MVTILRVALFRESTKCREALGSWVLGFRFLGFEDDSRNARISNQACNLSPRV